jgi:hypothetical protein
MPNLLSFITAASVVGSQIADRFPSSIPTVLRGKGTVFVVFDCVPEYSEQYSSNISAHPIETGSDIVDHVVNNNPSIELTGFITSVYHRLSTKTFFQSVAETVSNPLTATSIISSKLNLARQTTGDDWRDAYRVLKAMWESKQLLSLSSILGEHNDLIITDMSFPKNAENFGGLEISLTLQKVRIVSSSVGIVPVPEIVKKAEGATDKGKGNFRDLVKDATGIDIASNDTLLRQAQKNVKGYEGK